MGSESTLKYLMATPTTDHSVLDTTHAEVEVPETESMQPSPWLQHSSI